MADRGTRLKTREIVWTFNLAVTFEFACPIAGHYQVGMVGVSYVVALTLHGDRTSPCILPRTPSNQEFP